MPLLFLWPKIMIKGSIVAIVTPMHEDGSLDLAAFRALIDFHVGQGTDGLVVVGTTGESPTVDVEEHELLIAEAVKHAAGRIPVIAGTGANSTREAIELAAFSKKAGADASLTVVPYYNKPTQEGLYQHFKAIASATNLPCILYNVPSRTITELFPETVIRLSQIENIIGLKEASGKLEPVARVIDDSRPGFLVYSGNDSDTLPIMAIGGYGVISVASHLVGAQIREMIESYLRGKVQEAATIHRRLLPLVNALFVVSNPVPLKYALNKVGFSVGKPRLPLTEPDEKAAAVIDDALKNTHIDLPL
ncbi:MAG: 4-hydroxy-tetrahydrodipicolinate synthase [Sideroxyarcus sp.]|nr:4-hydroxy-tetrahydrodipicolinate synthase [Sideroxyarcus sp.]